MPLALVFHAQLALDADEFFPQLHALYASSLPADEELPDQVVIYTKAETRILVLLQHRFILYELPCR